MIEIVAGAPVVVPRVLAVLLLLLALAVTGEPASAWAHVGHDTVTGDAAPEATATRLPSDGGGSSSHHLPSGQCCLTAAACGGGGALVSAPSLPLPARQAPVAGVSVVRVLHSVVLAVADRPPRPV